MKIIAASADPTHTMAAFDVFGKFFPDLVIDVECTKNSAPLAPAKSDAALVNQARNAVDAIQKKFPRADYWFSIAERQTKKNIFAWVVLKNKEGFFRQERALAAAPGSDQHENYVATLTRALTGLAKFSTKT